MGLFNEHSSTTKTDSSSTQGPSGPQGIGYKLDANGNFDLENKKLTNVQNGDMDKDVMTKSQIEGYVSNKTQYLSNINPGEVKNNKAAIYSNTGSLHSNSLYLKDQYKQEVILHTENQDDNQIRLYIPNLKNYDSFGGRLKSSLVITSLDQIIEGRKVFHNIEVPNPAIDSQACNRAFVLNELSKISDNYVRKSGDAMIGSLIVPKDNYPVQGNLNKVINYEAIREIFLSKKEETPMETDLNMNNHHISNLKLPSNPDHACNKDYLDTELNHKVNRNELRDYMKLDGSKVMTGTLNMNNNRITNLPTPHLSTEPATKDYVTTVMNHLPSLFVDRQGKSKMLGNLDINQHKIINVIEPTDDLDVSNKLYTDNQIIKSNIKPNSIPKNAFKYLMDDVNEWSSEYNIKVLSFSDLAESPHSWDKRVLNITPVKDGKNYRFRLGLQMFPMKTNETYSLIVELYNRDFKTWGRQETYVEATGIWLKSHNTTKFQHQYGSSGDLYYSKTLIKFKKTSSSAPVFVYYTVHFDDRGGDMNTYPLEFKNQVYILAYGIVGETDHVDNRVYDEHQAFEIDKTKMKMLVPLDLNNKKIINISNDSDVTKINLYGMVDKRRFFTAFTMPIEFNKVRIVNIKLLNTLKTRLKKDVINFYITSSSIIKYPFTFPGHPAYIYIQINKFFNVIHYIKLVNTVDIPFQITYDVFY